MFVSTKRKKWDIIKGTLLKRVPFSTFGKNMCSAALYSSSCLFLISKASNWEVKILKISVLKFSNKFPSSVLMTPLVPAALEVHGRPPLTPFPSLALLQEYFRHNSTISSKGLWETSLDSMRIRTSTYSSMIPLRKRCLTASSWRVLYLDFCNTKLKRKYSVLSSSCCCILKISWCKSLGLQ